MLSIKNYVRAKTLEEAYTLAQKRSNVVLGGMLWLKMQHRTIQTAIDLCDLGLDWIREKDEGYHIGAMVSLRALETHKGLNEMTQGAFYAALHQIVGVQFRNSATVGGSLYGRFGFSDVLTLFEVLDAEVVLYRRGRISLLEFAAMPRQEKDILVEVIVPKRPMRVAYLSQRNTATDFPVVACAVSCMEGRYICAVGARPAKAMALADETGILENGITEKSAADFGAWIAQWTRFGSNLRGSAEYRQKVCAVLVRRAVLLLGET